MPLKTPMLISILYTITKVLSIQFMKGEIYLANKDIKLAAAGAGIRMWQIAEELGILDCNLSRKLRHELPNEQKAEILSIIARLSANEGGGENNAKANG